MKASDHNYRLADLRRPQSPSQAKTLRWVKRELRRRLRRMLKLDDRSLMPVLSLAEILNIK